MSEGKIDMARKYHMTFRLIDDVCAFDCPDFEELCSCYPAFLSLEPTTLPDGSVNFLGMNLSFTESGLHVKVYDKRKDFPSIPQHQPYGVFIGLLHRFYRICNRPKDFLISSVEVAWTLDNQGCNYMKLFKVFSSFLSGKGKLRWRINILNLTNMFRSLFYHVCTFEDLNHQPFM